MSNWAYLRRRNLAVEHSPDALNQLHSTLFFHGPHTLDNYLLWIVSIKDKSKMFKYIFHSLFIYQTERTLVTFRKN